MLLLRLFIFIRFKVTFHPVKRRCSIFGSRHLTYDLPLPIDECQTDDVHIRKRPSKRGRRFNSAISPKGIHTDVIRANSLDTHATGDKKKRTPVMRNVSSPTTLQSPQRSVSFGREFWN